MVWEVTLFPLEGTVVENMLFIIIRSYRTSRQIDLNLVIYIRYVYKRHFTFSKRLGRQLISLKNLILNS